MAVRGKSTHDRFVQLLQKGPMVLCSRTNTYYHLTDMNDDGNGGYIAKSHDNTIHDQYVERSKYGDGPHSQRGIKE